MQRQALTPASIFYEEKNLLEHHRHSGAILRMVFRLSITIPDGSNRLSLPRFSLDVLSWYFIRILPCQLIIYY